VNKYVVYCRVSTQRQGQSGLGLDAQRASAAAYSGKIVATFQEIETGKRSDRPELVKALAACRRHGATLLVAKLDRLARNVAFVANLMESRVDFICCDNPTATPLTIHILAAVAEDEAKRISRRTKEALAALKARGVKLGSDNMTPRINREGIAANAAAAQQHASQALPLARKLRQAGETLAVIADQLTDGGILTRRGLPWSTTAVLRLLSI